MAYAEQSMVFAATWASDGGEISQLRHVSISGKSASHTVSPHRFELEECEPVEWHGHPLIRWNTTTGAGRSCERRRDAPTSR